MPLRLANSVAKVASAALLLVPSFACSKAETKSSADQSSHASGNLSTVRLQPSDVTYLGAFRLPGGEDRPGSFAYGGSAMTYNPDGDPGGAGDGHPGSLFISGHDRLPYGELPDGSQIAEVSIPAPAVSLDPAALPEASFIQGFSDVTGGLFAGLDEIPRLGMQYLNHSATGPRIHLTWGQHLQDERPSHALFSPTLTSPSPQGAWYVGNVSIYSINGYIFEIPSDWANTYVHGRMLATGRFRDGGWSGKGPALLAYVPWTDASGSLPSSGARIEATTLLQYESSEQNENVTHQALNRYQCPDEWEGGAWATTPSGKSAVVFVGTKSVGTKYWYGWAHPGGADLPCIETEYRDQYTTCWTDAGVPCPASDLTGCTGHNDFRGWWSTRFAAQIIFYDPADLARVASGAAAPHEPQPYAELDIDLHLLHNPSQVELDMLGQGVQRRYRIGETAYDRLNNRLYVLELFADGTKPVVHVFSLGS